MQKDDLGSASTSASDGVLRASRKPDCYKCVHRRDLSGDCHSSCAHPAFRNAAAENPMAQLLSLLGGRIPVAPIQVDGIRVVGNPHGIRKGWFQHPFNFDPVWLQECSGFTPKGAAAVSQERGPDEQSVSVAAQSKQEERE